MNVLSLEKKIKYDEYMKSHDVYIQNIFWYPCFRDSKNMNSQVTFEVIDFEHGNQYWEMNSLLIDYLSDFGYKYQMTNECDKHRFQSSFMHICPIEESDERSYLRKLGIHYKNE